jgi:transcriptional regulator with XRE-family HTH domain
MGSPRAQTAGLADKLRFIRTRLALSQAQMTELLKAQRLPAPLKIYPGNISRFEQGMREPPPLILLAYARAVGVTVETLIDADLELPDRLVSSPAQESLTTDHKSKLRHSTKRKR